MCGIVGLFSAKGLSGYRSALQTANDIVDYRGPDGAGFVLLDTRSQNGGRVLRVESMSDQGDLEHITLVLGHRRLAIIDLSPSGLQPMANEDKSLWITYNGEVYNYLELRVELERAGYAFRSQSDTEVVLRAYEEWGEDCVSRFNGMWAFAIADLRQQKLFCSRDRIGIKPFHYYHDGDCFLLGSEIKQLLCFPFVRKQINSRAVYEFLAYAAVDHCEETFFANIRQLLQGHNLILDLEDVSLTTTRYYHPQFKINTRVTLTEATEEFRRLLTDSVRLRLRSDVEVGSCLSGGLDSSSIVCLMHQLLKREGRGSVQRTFSSHFHEKEANELEFMEAVIQSTDVKAGFIYPTPNEFLHDMERLVWHQDEPFGSTSIFAQWSVFKLVNGHGVKVMLDGQGADELLAGYIPLAYHFFQELQAKQQHGKLLWEMLRHMQFNPKSFHDSIGFNRFGTLLRRLKLWNRRRPSVDWINTKLVEHHKDVSEYLSHLQVKPFGEQEHLSNILYQLTFHTNLQQLLHYEDRNSMAFSVESRVPYLDYRLVEFVFSLPADFKIRNGYTKRVLRDAMAGIIPEKIRWRVSKLGFATPERTWQKTMLRPLVRRALDDERLHDFVLPDKAQAYQEQVEKANLSDSASWRWLNLLLWINAYGL